MVLTSVISIIVCLSISVVIMRDVQSTGHSVVFYLD